MNLFKPVHSVGVITLHKNISNPARDISNPARDYIS